MNREITLCVTLVTLPCLLIQPSLSPTSLPPSFLPPLLFLHPSLPPAPSGPVSNLGIQLWFEQLELSSVLPKVSAKCYLVATCRCVLGSCGGNCTPINLKGHRSYNHTDYPCILKMSNDNQYRNMRRLLLYLRVQLRRLSILLEYNHHYYLKGTKTSLCKEKYRQMHAKMCFLNSRHIHINYGATIDTKYVICGKNIRSSHLSRFHSFPKDAKR